MEFTANKNLIKKDEKLFIVNKFDNFFYRELAIDARANFLETILMLIMRVFLFQLVQEK